MNMQPNSSLVPYLTVADLLLRKDSRSVAQFLSDDPSLPVQVSDLPTNLALLEIINSAGGELEAACLRAEIYAPDDLQRLNGQSLSFMKKILSNIVMFNLISRRPGPDPSEVCKNDYEWSMKQLEDISNGKRIFSFIQTEQAGLPANYRLQPIDQIRNGFLPAVWQRSFGIRTNMMRPF